MTETADNFKKFAQYLSEWIERDNTEYAVYRLTMAGHEHLGFSPSRKQINEIAQIIIASLNPDVADEFISAMRRIYAGQKPILACEDDIGKKISFLLTDKHGIEQVATEILIGFIHTPYPAFISDNGKRRLIGCATEILEIHE